MSNVVVVGEELLDLPFLQLDQVEDSLHAYQLAKRANWLRVMAEAVRWGTRGARVNTISPGIVITPHGRATLGVRLQRLRGGEPTGTLELPTP